MLCYLRALLFKNSWYHYVILQRWGQVNSLHDLLCLTPGRRSLDQTHGLGCAPLP